MKSLKWFLIIFGIIGIVLTPQNAFSEKGTVKIRAGHFPNVTHAPALIAKATKHFETHLGPEADIEWKTFHAGPGAIEALFAGEIDILYVGPNPAINGFIKSKGEALRVVSGVASGGSAFVVRKNSGIQKFEDIQGKKVATPQKGNTQDVALLHLMRERGLKPRAQGGKVDIFNINAGDQMIAFAKEQIDAIWTVEPWVSRLVAETDAKILFEESELWPNGDYATTLLVVRKKFMDGHPEVVQQWVKAHTALMNWIEEHLTEAKRLFNEELKHETGKALPPVYLDQSFGRIIFTADPMEPQVLEAAKRASEIGYLGRNKIDLNHLYELSFWEQAKTESQQHV
ncbi:MAG: ABC transporter substrate-binding protein [Candidatus Omnitrophica bacterium]|nr:ABC transporter substrate-binding protein [Candidatus Omnitrophota bacterium]